MVGVQSDNFSRLIELRLVVTLVWYFWISNWRRVSQAITSVVDKKKYFHRINIDAIHDGLFNDDLKNLFLTSFVSMQ